ncbi:MAG: DUF805 domain-containing protein [Lachnospiraceae bacterium]|nr:DUF805 domain-containing protein [Lachnospiraceae bacterium]
MKEMRLSMQNIFKNLFRWRGRMSRAEYWYARFFGFLTDCIMGRLVAIFSTLAFSFFFYIYLLYRAAFFLVFLFAAIRRYHDSGKSGYLALILDGFGRLLATVSFAWFLFIFFLFGLGAPEENVMPLLYGGMTSCVVSGIFCTINMVLLLRRSDPNENAYGKPQNGKR